MLQVRQSDARKGPFTGHDVLPRSARRERKRAKNRVGDKRAAPPSVDSDNDDLEEGNTSPKSLAEALDHGGLVRPGAGSRDRLTEAPEESAARLERLKGAVRTLLECVGEDPDREGLLATPERYAKAMMSLTKGYEENVLDIVNGAVFCEDHEEMVVVKDIALSSLCEHHLLPFTGKMHIGYIPNRSVIGLSKLARIAEVFACRLQVQERLTRSVADAVYKVLQPQGVAVVMESTHLCMAMRGVQKTDSTTVTSCMVGCFEGRSEMRNEFLSLVNMKH